MKVFLLMNKKWNKVLAGICAVALTGMPVAEASPLQAAVSETREVRLANTKDADATMRGAFGINAEAAALGIAAVVPEVKTTFGEAEKKFTNTVLSFDIGKFVQKDADGRIPDSVAKSVRTFLNSHLEVPAGPGQQKGLKSVQVNDFGGVDLTVHVTHNYGDNNALVFKLIKDAVLEALKIERDNDGLTEAGKSLLRKRYNNQLTALRVNPMEHSVKERGAESVTVAKIVGGTVGAVNALLFRQFAQPGTTPLNKLNSDLVKGFRFHVRAASDLRKGITDGKIWEFEFSEDHFDKDGNFYPGVNDSNAFLALASQPNDYVITAIYPVENDHPKAVDVTEPAVSIQYQTVGTDGGQIMNPTLIFRSQSGFDAVGGIANFIYRPTFVPGGENGDYFVATKPVTMEDARKPVPEGYAHVATYGYQSRNDGEIPVEGVRDHVAFDPQTYKVWEELSDRLADTMKTHKNDQPYLAPHAAEARVHEQILEQADLFHHAPKEAEVDEFLAEVEAKVQSGELITVTDDKADMGGRHGHTNVPEMFLAIYRATLYLAVKKGLITSGNTIGFGHDELLSRVKDIENIGVGDDGHFLMLGDKSEQGLAAHKLAFLAFTRAYLFGEVTGKKYYGLGQDFAGPEAQAAKKAPFAYSEFKTRAELDEFLDILRQVMPENELKLGVLEKVAAEWELWKGGKGVQLTEPFSGNVSQQGIGSARYFIDPKEETTVDVVAGDKMGPAALNRVIREASFNAVEAGTFDDLIMEIWDLKAFEADGTIKYGDLPRTLKDIEKAGAVIRDAADLVFVQSLYSKNGNELKTKLSKKDRIQLSNILKVAGFVPAKRIFLSVKEDREEIIKYLADSDRFNVKHVWSKKQDGWDIQNPKAYLNRPVLAASVTRLGILSGGEYLGKDDPVMLGNTKLFQHIHDFLRDNPLIVQGDMNGSHWEQVVVKGLTKAVATLRSHPIMVGMRYTIGENGKRLTKVEDIYGGEEFNKIRDQAHLWNAEFNEAQVGGQMEPHGTNSRTVEAAYALAKTLRALNRADSKFLLGNKRVLREKAADHKERLAAEKAEEADVVPVKADSVRRPKPVSVLKDVAKKAGELGAAALGAVEALDDSTRQQLGDVLRTATAANGTVTVTPDNVAQAAGTDLLSATAQDSVGFVFSRALVFDGGLGAAIPHLRSVFGSQTPVLVMVTTDAEAEIIAMVNQDLAPEDRIIAVRDMNQAEAILREQYKVSAVRYVGNGGDEEAAAMQRYINEYIYLSDAAVASLVETLGLTEVVQQFQGLIAFAQSA